MQNLPFIDKLAWIHIVDGRILCALSKGKDTCYLPGGKREPGETDAQALIREIREELSVELVPESLAWVGVFEAQAHGKEAGRQVRMTCYTAGYTGEIVPAAEIASTAWLTHRSRDQASPVLKLILDWLYLQGWIVD